MKKTMNKEITIRGEASGMDKGALLSDVIILGILLWNQLRYGMNMLFLIIPLTLIGIYLILFGMVPDTYCFTKDSLEIVHKFRKRVKIPYETVFNYESSARDSFINITQRNLVKVYHTVGNKKKLTVCRPCDVESFVDALRTNCREFHEEPRKSPLDVFFEHPNENEKGDM